ncbi:MAG: Nif3-like dinuclear metal center hexameric protein [Spirochaetota bacterium]
MPTVQAVIDSIIAGIRGAPFEKTVDSIKVGDADAEVRGILTTFLATDRLLHFAVEHDLNLIVTHEPTFYHHFDELERYRESEVLRSKLAFAEEHNLVIWRCHDYAHRHDPDVIVEGVVEALRWEKYREQTRDYPLFELTHRPRPSALANEIKSALGTSRVLVAGDPDAACRRVALLVGAQGGERQIEAAIRHDVDALVAGEINEWEVAEYFRDAAFQKRGTALLVVGHQPSEEAGMARLAKMIEARFPEIPVIHRAAGDPLRVV